MSSSMSLASASSAFSASAPAASYTGTITPDSGACIGAGGQGQSDQVKVGDVLNVTFRGSPPYNVTRSIEHNGSYYCDLPVEGNVTTNAWSWTVQPFFWSSEQNGPNATVLNPGDSVVFVATELAIGLVNNHYSSSNFTVITNEESGGGRTVSGLKTGLVMGLLLATTILTTL